MFPVYYNIITTFLSPRGKQLLQAGAWVHLLSAKSQIPARCLACGGAGRGGEVSRTRAKRIWALGSDVPSWGTMGLYITSPGLSPFISKMEIRKLIPSPWGCQENPVLTLRSPGTVWGTCSPVLLPVNEGALETRGCAHV